MEPILNIFCHLERLGPEYDEPLAAEKFYYFSLNLTVALTANPDEADIGAAVAKYLRLWIWDWEKLTVRGVKTIQIDGAPVDISEEIAAELTPIPDGLSSGQRNDLSKIKISLQNEFSRTLGTAAQLKPRRFLWNINDPLPEAEISEEERDWRSFIAHVSTFPAPLPQYLRFAVNFRVNKTVIDQNAYQEIIAAPIIKGFEEGTPLTDRLKPQTPLQNQLQLNDPNNPLHRVNLLNLAAAEFTRPYFYEWRYEAGEIAARAYQKECVVALAPKPAESFLDLQTQWVVNPGNASVLQSRDWTAQFELRLADAFDMAARLLDTARDKIGRLPNDNNQPIPADYTGNWEAKLEEGFVASLRDLAGYGLSKSADGESFAEYLMKKFRGANATITDEIIRFLEAKDIETTLEHWKSYLENFIRDFEKTGSAPVFPARPDKIGGLEKYKKELQEYLQGLERIHALLANDEALAMLFIKGWETVFALADTSQNIKAFWLSNKSAIVKHLSELQLRKRIALGNARIAWSSLKDVLHLRDRLKTSVFLAFTDYFDNRFGNPTGGSEYRSYRPRTPEKPFPQVPDILREGFFNKFIDEIILSNADNSPDDNLPEGLTIQVDQIQRSVPAASQADALADQEDYLRKISGIGILIRRTAPTVGDWRCLNLADIYVNNNGGGMSKIWQAASVPLRLTYRNELRQCTFFYNNYPLAAANPSQGLSQKNEFAPETPTDFSALLDYENPYLPAASAPKLEPLIYGQNYEFAVFIKGNSGNLPKEIAAESGGQKIPWKFSLPTAALPFKHPLEFRRTKAVGALRIESRANKNPGSEMGELKLPVIPDDVHPITRSLQVRHIPDNAPQLEQIQRENPLILLVNRERDVWKEEVKKNNSNFEFSIRPPSVPLDIWHYWILGDAGSLEKRIYVWGKYHELNDVVHDENNPSQSGNKKNQPDATIDDPAVTGFQIKMTKFYPKEEHPPFISKDYDFPLPASFVPNPPDDMNKPLKYVQSVGRKIKIETGAAEMSNPTVADITIKVPEGEVWQIEYTPKIPQTGKFKNNAPRFKTSTMYAEVAKPFPTDTAARDSLHNALQASFLAGKNRARAALDETVIFKDLIFKTDILVQRWRWDGRPVCFFGTRLRQSDLKNPADFAGRLHRAESFLEAGLKARLSEKVRQRLPVLAEGGAAEDGIIERFIFDLNEIIGGNSIFNGEHFAGIRLNSETETLISENPPPGEKREKLNRLLLEDAFPDLFEGASDDPVYGFPFGLAASDDSFDGVLFSSRGSDDYLQITSQIDFVGLRINNLPLNPLFERELSDSPGALYYRFAVRVHSRYAGLMDKNSLIDSRLAIGDKAAERWKRLEIKCRWKKQVPLPVVKFICPLTQTHSADEITAGFLVVLDEPWYQDTLGGLAEKFKVDIIRSALPNDPQELRYQFGADPIIEMSDDPLKGKTIEIPPPVGAIGYTFDTDTQAPLFNSSSFIIPAPQIDSKIENLWWYFLKVRFRREFDPNGLAGQPTAAARSNWTDGVWVQMLPPTNRFTIEPLENAENEDIVKTADVEKIFYDVKAEKFFFQKNPETEIGIKILPAPSKQGFNVFSLYALQSVSITDALGRQNQEAFVEFFKIENLQEKIRQLPDAIRDNAKFRLVEIQSRGEIADDPQNPNKIFDCLFTEQGKDAEARIVRVSPIIRQR